MEGLDLHSFKESGQERHGGALQGLTEDCDEG